MSAGLALPKRVFGHGLLTKDGLKMGKTLGNTIDPYALVDRFGADPIRYYFLKEIEFGRDGDFNEERFVAIVNADLANSLGNLLNRSLGMANKYCQQTIPYHDPSTLTEVSDFIQPIIEQARDLGDRVAIDYQNLNFRAACEKILELIWNCNKLIDETTPWKLFKAGKQKEVNETLYTLLESVRIAVYLLSPITPVLSISAYQQLGLIFDETSPPDWSHKNWGILQAGKPLSPAIPIFQRIEYS
jgi:methionyl-tRNA synthetase